MRDWRAASRRRVLVGDRREGDLRRRFASGRSQIVQRGEMSEVETQPLEQGVASFDWFATSTLLANCMTPCLL